MKRSLFMLGVAVAALSSCSQSETLEVAEGRAIGFSSFVNNNTRAAITEIAGTDDLTEYYVYGYHTDNIPVFENVKVTTNGTEYTAYWEQGKTYNFAAYSDGNSKIDSDISFSSTEDKLTISNYTPDNSKDLVAAIAEDLTCNDPSTQGKVGLTFKHLLSQVKFTFTNTDSRSYTMKISDIQIANAIKTAKVEFTGTGSTAVPVWSGSPTGSGVPAYEFDDLNDIAADGTHETECLVIPQSNENLQVTFTATFWDNASSENPIRTGKFVASLKYTGSTSGTTANEWTAGFRYNYTAEVNADDIKDDQKPETLHPIEFNATVSGWGDAASTTVIPGKPGN